MSKNVRHIRQAYNISQFPKLQVNYWGIPKCANTTLKYILLRTENPTLVEQFDRKKENRAVNIDGNPNRGWVHQKCHYITPVQASQNGFTNFTALRDPVQRAYSMHGNSLSRPARVSASGSNAFKQTITRLFQKHQNRPSLIEFLKIVGQFSDEDRNIHYRSQKSYCLVDDIIKLDVEMLSSTIQHVHPSLVVDVRLNVSTKHPTPDSATLQQIHEVFSEDFKIWNECIKGTK